MWGVSEAFVSSHHSNPEKRPTLRERIRAYLAERRRVETYLVTMDRGMSTETIEEVTATNEGDASFKARRIYYEKHKDYPETIEVHLIP